MSDHIPAKRAVRSRPKTDWHLVCITRKGRVSILKNLDLRTARETYKRLRPDEHPKDYKFPDCKECGKQTRSWGRMGGIYGSDDDRLQNVDAIGPEGEELNPWEGVEPYVIDMSHLCRCERAPSPNPAGFMPPGISAMETRFDALVEAGGDRESASDREPFLGTLIKPISPTAFEERALREVGTL